MKKYFSFLFIIMMVTALSSSGIMADEVPVHQSSAESTVLIEFAAGDANVDPLNPDAPSIVGNGGTGEQGSLALNYVSNFYFEPQVVTSTLQELPTTTQRPYIQVTDVRGTGAGWEVYAGASKFQDEYSTASLKGASLEFHDVSLATTTTEVDEPEPVADLILPADSSTIVKVVEAEQLAGMGTWLVRWYKSGAPLPNTSVRLKVPGGTGMLGQNTSTITWYLTLGSVT